MTTLWDSTTLGPITLKNRFWRGAFHERLATPEGYMTPELLDLYQEIINGGVGCILTSYTRVMADDFPNFNMLGMFTDDHIPGYLPLTQRAHEAHVAIIMQLTYGGARTVNGEPDHRIWGPSAIENPRTHVTPSAMTKADIGELVDSFAAAAFRAKQAGFDGVQVHGAHGYLLSTWLSPYFNRRDDEYGGSIENRTRIFVEIHQAIQKKCGPDYPVLVKFNCTDYAHGGLTEEDSICFCQILEHAGYAAMEISGGNECFPEVAAADLGPSRKKLAKHPERTSYFANYAQKLSHAIDAPIILIGGNRVPAIMEDILGKGYADYFGIVRPLNAQPDLIHLWEHDESAEPKCVACNKCFKTVGHRCILRPGTQLL